MQSFKSFIREWEQSWQDQTNAFHANIRTESGIGMRDFSESLIESTSPEDRQKINNLHDELSHRHDYGINDNHNLRDYTHASRGLNEYLWHSHTKPQNVHDYEHEAYKPAINAMDTALSQYKVKTPMTVYSSTRHDPRVKKNESDILHHPAYMSTSLDRSVAVNRKINAHMDENRNEHHHVLKINVPAETHGAYVGHISKYKSEKEFILPRGMNFKYHGTKTHTVSEVDPFTDKKVKSHTHIHHMSIIPKEESVSRETS